MLKIEESTNVNHGLSCDFNDTRVQWPPALEILEILSPVQFPLLKGFPNVKKLTFPSVLQPKLSQIQNTPMDNELINQLKKIEGLEFFNGQKLEHIYDTQSN